SVRGGDRAVAENLPRAPAPRWLRCHPATTREDGQTFVDVAVDESELPSRAPVGSSLARSKTVNPRPAPFPAPLYIGCIHVGETSIHDIAYMALLVVVCALRA